MSTLGTDFGKNDRSAFLAHHLAHWLAWSVPPASQQQVHEDIMRALAHDPTMTEWADWPAIWRKGIWLRSRDQEQS